MDYLNDYSRPCLLAEKALRDLHNAVLDGNLKAAVEFAEVAVTEARMTRNMLILMREKEGAA